MHGPGYPTLQLKTLQICLWLGNKRAQMVYDSRGKGPGTRSFKYLTAGPVCPAAFEPAFGMKSQYVCTIVPMDKRFFHYINNIIIF